MKGDLYSYMNLGINHHLLNIKCFTDSTYHLKTLIPLLNHPSFQVVDLFVVDDGKIREKEIVLIQNSGKEIVYNGAIMLPSKKYNPHSLVEEKREEIFQILKHQADLAIEVNASKFVIASNYDPEEEKRERAKEGFAQFLYDFARYVSDNSQMKIVLEPSDREVDKRLLLGPTRESIEVVRMARDKGAQNLGLMIDMGHLPLLGESFEYAIRTCGELLWHIHIGNCIKKDKNHIWYGDKHPPIGFPGGEHGVDELADFLQLLLKYNYLKKAEKNSVTLEVQTFPGRTAQETLSQQLQLLKKAWERIKL